MTGKLEAAWGMTNILGDQDSVFVIRSLSVDADGIFSVHHHSFHGVSIPSVADAFKEGKELRWPSDKTHGSVCPGAPGCLLAPWTPK